MYIYKGKTSLITPDLLSLLQLSTRTLKSVNLGYSSFNIYIYLGYSSLIYIYIYIFFFQFQPAVRIFRLNPIKISKISVSFFFFKKKKYINF